MKGTARRAEAALRLARAHGWVSPDAPPLAKTLPNDDLRARRYPMRR